MSRLILDHVSVCALVGRSREWALDAGSVLGWSLFLLAWTNFTLKGKRCKETRLWGWGEDRANLCKVMTLYSLL